MADDNIPHVLSDDEIELYLKGDRREVDRLILLSLNKLATALIPRIRSEAELLERIKQIGGVEAIIVRASYVDSLIKRNMAKTAMMEKVSQGAALWVALAFLGAIIAGVWDALIHAIKLKLGV